MMDYIKSNINNKKTNISSVAIAVLCAYCVVFS